MCYNLSCYPKEVHHVDSIVFRYGCWRSWLLVRQAAALVCVSIKKSSLWCETIGHFFGVV